MSKENIYLIPDKKLTAVMDSIKTEYTVETESVTERLYNIWDTFDWKVVRNNYILSQSDDKFSLTRSGEALFFERLESIPETLNASSFKGAGFSEIIGGMVLNRAILLRSEVTEKKKYLKILNRDSKIIFHLDLVEFYHGSTVPSRFFVLRPLRGYDEEAKEFNALLDTLGCIADEASYEERVIGSTFDNLYSSKMNLDLDANDDTQTAAKKIISQMYTMAIMNIDGVIRDYDIEFLHDLRVYTRRLRSFITQVRGVFPEELIVDMKKDFSTVSGKTGTTRDLDVYLEDQDQFIDMVPEEMKPGLEKLFGFLAQTREKEFEKLKVYMNSDEFRSTLKKWEEFINSQQRYNEENSMRPVRETANFFIMKKYRKIVKRIGAIHKHTDDILMHDLRIECKKLRYLLEAFSSLYSPKQINKLIKELKKFQDYLGLLNDLSVQKETLRSYLRRLNGLEDAVMIASSVGALIVKLDEKHIELKETFVEALKRFEKSDSPKVFNELFGG